MSYLDRIDKAIQDLERWKENRARKRLNNRSLDYAINVLKEARISAEETTPSRKACFGDIHKSLAHDLDYYKKYETPEGEK